MTDSLPSMPPLNQKWLLILGCLGIAPFILFHWLIESYLRVVIWPWILVWQLGFMAIFVLGILLLQQSRYPVQGLGYGLDWFVGILLLSLLLSTVFSPFPAVALWNASRVFSFLILLYVGRNCLNHDRFQPRLHLHQLWFAVVTIGLITGIISFSLWRPTPEMWLSSQFLDAIRNHLPLGNNNFVGGYAVLLLPVTVMFPFAYGGWRRIFGIVASLVAAALLYSSGSRGGLLGAIVIVTLFVLAAFIQSQGKQRIKAIVLGLFGFVLMIATLFSNPRIRQFLVTGGIDESIHRFSSDGPFLDRLIMLQSLGHLFQQRPWVGVGPGNMSRMYNLYRPIESGNWSMHVQQLHNTPAQFLGELGLLGLLAYIGFLIYLTWMNLKLYPRWQTQEQRFLALGVNISFLGYATSSFTDYQLENIGIVTLLIINLWLWIGLLDLANAADASLFTPFFRLWIPSQITLNSPALRRILSIGLLVTLGFCGVIWFPIDAASAISIQAARQAIVGNFAQSDPNWNLAAYLVPWDPIYPVAAGQQLLDVAKTVTNPEDQQAIREQVIQDYRQAVKAAPNDALFQQNLAVVSLEKYPQEARDHALQSVNLQNRDITYSYYALGLAYLNNNQRSQAIDAFVLQALNRPHILNLTLDKDPRLQQIKADILQRSLDVFKQFLASIPPETPGYAFLQEQVALVRWWHHDLSPQDLAEIPTQPFSPIAQALMLAETQPQKAIEILNKNLDSNPKALPQLLLRAWIDPKLYFQSFATTFNNPRKSAAWNANLQQYRDLKQWLGSVTAEEIFIDRLALWLTYRNMNAINASKTLIPAGIFVSSIAQDLNLYPALPRYFPELDHLIYTYRTRHLETSPVKE